MTGDLLPTKDASAIEPAAASSLAPEILTAAASMRDELRHRGEAALRGFAERFDNLAEGSPLILGVDALNGARETLDPADRAVLERTAERITTFAQCQLQSLRPMTTTIPGGEAGHSLAPVERVLCYAPGGRYPLPSSVLMTAITARVAGVRDVLVASPRPTAVTLAAAAIARADAVLPIGGAQVIFAAADGCAPIDRVDAIVGPGNAWVTAAKKLVAGEVRIDSLAGPSELVVVVDESADPETAAADLLAQAEHDPDARVVLVSLHRPLLDAVRAAVRRQLEDLPTADVAHQSLVHGAAVAVSTREEAIALCDRLAPEHLQLSVREPQTWQPQLSHFGALFCGELAAEVLGDYGIGPNHVLPTGGGARRTGGLSVLDFLRVRTWMRLDKPSAASGAIEDAVRLAEMEGLAAHARAARRRLGGGR